MKIQHAESTISKWRLKLTSWLKNGLKPSSLHDKLTKNKKLQKCISGTKNAETLTLNRNFPPID